MQAVKTLAAYLQSHPHVGRVTTCDPNCSSEWPCELYSDSDWAGCLETRRSTDCYIAVVCVVQSSHVAHRPNRAYQRQVRPDAELRGVSRAAREAIFLKELITRDFGQQCGKPRLWTDSSSAMQASKRIGPGSKLRHLEVCEFYVQGALQSKQIALGKVKGTVNCANFLTKHPKSGTEVRQTMPGLGMYEARDGEDVLSSSKKISVKVSTVTKQHAWKTPTPACVGWSKDQDRAGRTATAYRQDGQLVGCMKALVVLSQIQAVAGQPTYCLSQYEWYGLFFLAGIGMGVLMWAIWQLARQFIIFVLDWVRPIEPEAQETGHEVQLHIQDQQITLRIRVTATGDNQQLTLINPAPAATPRSEPAADPRTPAETPRSPEELTPRGIERWHEERWVREAAEARMTMQELIEWRNQEESLLRGEHPDGMSDLKDSESNESEAAPASAGSTAEERAAPPERADPPREPESEADAASIERSDPFAHMSPAELEQWRRAEDRFLGM